MTELTAEVEREITLVERRRCVGLVLREYAIQKAGGREQLAQVLDALATALEHPESRAYRDTP